MGARGGALPRRLPLAPGAWRLIFGLLLCLPGGLVILAGLAIACPGLLLADSGITRLAKQLVGKPQPQIPPLQDARNPRSSMTWPAPTPRHYQ